MQNRSSRGDLERASERRYVTTSRCDDPTQLGYTAGVARKLIQAPAMQIRFPYQREIYGKQLFGKTPWGLGFCDHDASVVVTSHDWEHKL